LVAISEQGFSATAPTPTVVDPGDIFDTFDNSDSPTILDLRGPPARPKTLFDNPALVLQSLTGSPFLAEQDQYLLVLSDSTRPLTISVFTFPPGVDGMFVDLESLGSLSTCKGELVGPGINSDRVVFALKQTEKRSLLLRVSGNRVGPYGIKVEDEYVLADPRIEADRFEENDYCTAADANFQRPDTRIDTSEPFAETLTIDNPNDPDWFKFSVGPDSSLVTVRTVARPFAASDSSDIDLEILMDRGVGSPLRVTGISSEGSTETLSIELSPGIYYLLVSDVVGVVTRYSMCIAAGNNCTLPPHPPSE
jgi:hypothetical protein